MLILSPKERAQAWYEATSAGQLDREFKRHMLATVAFQMVGSELSLYQDDYAVALKASLDLLDISGLIGRDELRQAFEEIDEDRGTARAFVAALSRHLRESAMIDRLEDALRVEAFTLADLWREAAADDIAGEVEDDDETYVTVAEVAAAYDVTPQAVYKWIHKGVIDARSRPGGSYQIPISALQRDARFDSARARRLQQELALRHGRQADISTAETIQQIRERRSASR